jgi:hypothetical protein
MIQIPDSAHQFGFNITPGGTHTSRTMMLSELQMLLASCPIEAAYAHYAVTVLEDNVLLKPTVSTRTRSLRGLRELYALDRRTLLFRALRDLWDVEATAQPLIALLCAISRDSTLRATSDIILTASPGDKIGSKDTMRSVGTAYPGRYNESVLGKIGRNTASSWTQSGHLSGRTNKQRVHVQAQPTSVTYALFLGYLCGHRGEALFQTAWAQLLDTSIPELHTLAQAASRQGYLDYRHAGGVTDISFTYLMRQE